MPAELQQILAYAPIVLIFIVMYFFLIRPQRKQQQRMIEMQQQLKKNDKIVTIGGIHGIIDEIKDDVVTIIVTSGARIKFERGAIKRVISE